ncbi:MAG TPA: RluA family pseudouridine synthase [Rectinemataceae bacterium]|nr:RluA family pseudouridine synthase [Rectinemataceae bacterium]
MPRELNYTEYRPGPDDLDKRLDRLLRRLLGDMPLSALYGCIRRGRIRVNGSTCRPDRRIAAGDRIEIDQALLGGIEAAGRAPGTDSLDSLAPILILATEDLLFINKPAGELVHGPGSLEERVRAALGDRISASLSFSPGPLHRLDRNTSGLVVYSRSARGARVFSECLRGRRIRKSYLALLRGKLRDEAIWSDTLERDTVAGISRVVKGSGGRQAISRARPLCVSEAATLALVAIETGLTHQIRVQAASRGLPLLGDAKYGGGSTKEGYLLHALSLAFPDRMLPDLPERITAPLPSAWLSRLERLFPGFDIPLVIDRARLS